MTLPAIFAISSLAGAQTASPLTHAQVDARVKALISKMTLAEKVAQLRSDWTPAIFEPALKSTGFGMIPNFGRLLSTSEAAEAVNKLNDMTAGTRFKVPVMVVEEAAHGLCAKGCTSFPQVIGMAATWNPDLVSQIAHQIGVEARARGVRQVLAPVINITRDARWGRVEETYGEDPMLSSEMAAAFVRSLERSGVSCTPKHWVANVGDGGRDSNSIQMSERALREIYFPPFQAAIERGGAHSVMSSYNSVNGLPTSTNPWLLKDVLRTEWGFRGHIISDWGAVSGITELHNTGTDSVDTIAKFINAGGQIECPTLEEAGKPLEDAIKKHLISMRTIDEAVAHVLTTKIEIGLMDEPRTNPATASSLVDTTESRALAVQAARQAMVLLKNDHQTLPLSKSLARVAVIGPSVSGPMPLGGYSGQPNRTVSVLQGLKERVPGVEFVPAAGVDYHSALGNPVPASALGSGLQAEFFLNKELTGAPALVKTDAQLDFDWGDGSPTVGIRAENYSIRWTGKLTAPQSADYDLSFVCDDGGRLYLDGSLVAEDWTEHSAKAITYHVHLNAGETHDLKIEYFQNGGEAVAKLLWRTDNSPNEALAGAVSAAKSCDAAIIVAGIIEGEGQDRSSLDLPGLQEDLIRAVAATGKPTVVVLLAGSPVTMERWLGSAGAVLDAWYPGQEGGYAIAETLFGDNNPGGKLPITFPRSVGQCPLYYNYEPTGRGYDYVDLTGQPRFAFGHGLSYTTFTYSDLTIEKGGGAAYRVSFTVENSGNRAGDEVPQLYLHRPKAEVVRPIEELHAFKRINLSAGEKKRVTLTLDWKDLSFLDAHMARIVPPGTIEVRVGSSSSDIRLKGTIELTGKTMEIKEPRVREY